MFYNQNPQWLHFAKCFFVSFSSFRRGHHKKLKNHFTNIQKSKTKVLLDIARFWTFEINNIRISYPKCDCLIMSEVQPDQSTVCPRWCCGRWRWLYATRSGFHSHESAGGSHLIKQRESQYVCVSANPNKDDKDITQSKLESKFIILTIWHTSHIREESRINTLCDIKLNQQTMCVNFGLLLWKNLVTV